MKKFLSLLLAALMLLSSATLLFSCSDDSGYVEDDDDDKKEKEEKPGKCEICETEESTKIVKWDSLSGSFCPEHEEKAISYLKEKAEKDNEPENVVDQQLEEGTIFYERSLVSDNLPNMDFGGRSFRIVTHMPYEIVVEEEERGKRTRQPY